MFDLSYPRYRTHGALALDRLVNAAVRQDPIAKRAHVAMVVGHTVGGIIAALVIGTYGWLADGHEQYTIFAIAWFLSPIAIAAYLRLSARLDIALLLSALNLAGLVGFAALMSGGAESFAVSWLLLVPLEASLARRRWILWVAAGSALAVLSGLMLIDHANLSYASPSLDSNTPGLAAAVLVFGIVYAASLATRIQSLYAMQASKLEQSRAYFRMLADDGSDLVMHHRRDGSVAFASATAEQVTGLGSARLCEDGFEALLPAHQIADYRAAFAEAATGANPISREFEVAVGERRRWLEMRIRRLSDVTPVGALAGASDFVSVTRDVTERKRHEEAMAEARAAAEEASRAKTRFIGVMSHELRTPLNAIIGFSELLHRELTIRVRDGRCAEYARTIHESGEHLLSIVSDLLDVSKIEAGKLDIIREPFAMEPLVRSTIGLMAPLTGKKSLLVDVEIAPDLPELAADRRGAKQILINLLSNACKFTPEGGRIIVSAKQQADRMIIGVQDSGVGIPAPELRKVVEPFFQVESSHARTHGGTGLGLAIVKGIVDLHDGALHIESEVGKGTRIEISLPNKPVVLEHGDAEAGHELAAVA